MRKLNRTEFYDVYGISLLEMDKSIERSELLIYLLPIAEKYLQITERAIRSELRHYNMRAERNDEWNYIKRTKKEGYIKNLKEYRKKCTLEQAVILFKDRKWAKEYGGKKWGNIAYEAIGLRDAIKRDDLKKILYFVDRLNDLEHNNALYLASYTTFSLETALYNKCEATPEEIIKECSYEIKKLYHKSLRG